MFKYGIYFAEPLWLIACILLVPTVWFGVRNLSALSKTRRYLAITLRCLTILILIAMLSRMMFTRRNEHVTVIAVLDRSQSISEDLQKESRDYLAGALAEKDKENLFAVVDVAEIASISSLPSGATVIRERNTTLNGQQSRIADGVQMALAIAPPDTATRILLVSDGNETAGNLKEAARAAAANGIRIDVLPCVYDNKNEVIFKRLAAPASARSGQTVSLRFILSSTTETTGKLVLNLNGKSVDLDPGSAEVAVPIELKPGTNVKTVSIPIGTRGIHDFQAFFLPDNPQADRIEQNNRASALTFVAGPGHIMVYDAGPTEEGTDSGGLKLAKALKNSDIDARYGLVSDFPQNLTQLMNTDGIILVNTGSDNFTYQQQELICSYVTDLGGGLIMVGGDYSFGAGGWIGSPVAEILPVDLDPPQKKQLPKGALVLIMHACEIPQGNYWGKKTAKAAIGTLSRLDLAGILAYGWQGGGNWVHKLDVVGDKKTINAKIDTMQMGDMPDLGALLQQAYTALSKVDAGQKHVLVISDGDPQPPTQALLDQCKAAGITCSGIAINPHSKNDIYSLLRVAEATEGRFYHVKNANQLPKIFIKEAQTVRRALILEETFTPILTYSLSEITKGISTGFPPLDGYVLTGPREGLSQIILSSHQGDPILASCQSGLGRAVAFTSSADSRWAANWLGWPGFETFWEQAVRWAARSTQNTDCDVFVDVQGKDVSVNVEAVDAKGKYMQFAGIDAQVIAPGIPSKVMELSQTGPGQYQGSYEAATSGSHIVNLRYRKIGEDDKTYTRQVPVTIPFAPEFRDLSDNAELLRVVAEDITGGRVLSKTPEADIFDATGLKFPSAQLPLTKPLMLIWLAVFLTDIAVRRISVDFKAMYRKAAAFVTRSKATAKATENLQRLRRTRQSAAEKLAQRSQKKKAAKRYDGTRKETADIPLAQDKVSAEPKPRKVEKEKKKTKEKPDAPQSHIDQLLKAKRKASDKD